MHKAQPESSNIVTSLSRAVEDIRNSALHRKKITAEGTATPPSLPGTIELFNQWYTTKAPYHTAFSSRAISAGY